MRKPHHTIAQTFLVAVFLGSSIFSSGQTKTAEGKEQEKERAEVRQLLNESYALFNSNTSTAITASLEKASKANELSSRIGYKEGEAYSLIHIGNVQAQLGHSAEATNALSKAVQLLHAL